MPPWVGAVASGARVARGRALLCALALLLSAGCGGGSGNAAPDETSGSHEGSGSSGEVPGDDGGAGGDAGTSPGEPAALQATVTYPFLLTDPQGGADYFPTVFAHLLGQPIAWTD